MNEKDKFDARLEALHGSRNCGSEEIEASVLIYERLKTAQSICQSIFSTTPDQSAIVAVFAELCAEARLQGSDDIE